MPRKTERMLQLEEKCGEIQSNLSAVVDDQLPAELRERVRSLLSNLARNDLSMALLDLAQLSRTLTGTAQRAAGADRSFRVPGVGTGVRVLIYGKGERAVAEQCEGPTGSGGCPRVIPGAPVACAGKWIMAAGWRFMMACDAASCPVAEIGLAHGGSASGDWAAAAGTPTPNPDDVFVSGPAANPAECSGDLLEEGYRLTGPRA